MVVFFVVYNIFA